MDHRAKCINPTVKNSPKCLASKLNNMCLTLSPLVSLMYWAKCINLRVNNSPKCSYPNLQTCAWPYPPWLVSCNERSVFVPEWTTPQLSSMCLTLSPMVSLMYQAKCIHPRLNNSPKFMVVCYLTIHFSSFTFYFEYLHLFLYFPTDFSRFPFYFEYLHLFLYFPTDFSSFPYMK